MTDTERNYKRRRLESNLADAGLLDMTDSKRNRLEAELHSMGVPAYEEYQAPRPKTATEREKGRRRLLAILDRLQGDREHRQSAQSAPKAHNTHSALLTHRKQKTRPARNTQKMTPDARRAFKKMNEERRKLFPESDFPNGVEIR